MSVATLLFLEIGAILIAIFVAFLSVPNFRTAIKTLGEKCRKGARIPPPQFVISAATLPRLPAIC